MISLNKCTGSCNVLSSKICVPKETNNINVKAFNMITNNHQVNTMAEYISWDCKCKFNNTICNSNQKWNYKTCQCEFNNYRKYKKDYSWNPSTCICEYLTGIANISVTQCDEITIAMDIVSTKKTNTVGTDVKSTVSVNLKVKGKKLLYFTHILLVII